MRVIFSIFNVEKNEVNKLFRAPSSAFPFDTKKICIEIFVRILEKCILSLPSSQNKTPKNRKRYMMSENKLYQSRSLLTNLCQVLKNIKRYMMSENKLYQSRSFDRYYTTRIESKF